MFGLTYAQLQQTVQDGSAEGLASLKLLVLRNITVEPIEPFLRFLALRCGWQADVRFGQFDNALQDALDDGKVTANLDVVLVFLKLDALSPILTRRFASLSSDALQAELARVRAYAETVLAGIRSRSSALILWHGFEMPCQPALGILDIQSDVGQVATVEALNTHIKKSLAATGNAYFVDMNICRARLGASHFYDMRYWHMARLPYTREGLEEIAQEEFKFVRALKGKAKKCLVLDCDNVLWGGVVGEDGIDGIRVGPDQKGSPYYELQEAILSFADRGVILALCSKNNEDDVWEVFRKHPGMLLRQEQIAAAMINWDDKVTNLQRIADTLNIGLDSLVFVDDSEYEVAHVRQALPQVEVIHLPAAQAYQHAATLAGCGWFDALSFTDEDRSRGQMYRANVERAKLQSQVTDLGSYLQSLEMEVEVKRADLASAPRVAQLIQRTNQFNLTSQRHTEADLRRFLQTADANVLTLQVKDRFGDLGTVGVAILLITGIEAEIESLLMSCRVIGRGIEQAFLESCLKMLERCGVLVVRGRYLRTKKNGLVADFFSQQGFTLEHATADEAHFVLRLDQPRPQPALHFKRVLAA